MSEIELQSAEKWFGARRVIHGADLVIKSGELMILVGPSGCGKSTLLRMIAGLEDIGRGKILIDGRDLSGEPPAARRLAMVFQSYALYPHMSVRENLGFGLKMAGARREQVAAKVERAAAALRLEELLDYYPRALSGGQRQRVAIGRCIVRDPSAFLFDEPLSNLDAALRVEMRLEIAKLHRALGATMIYVTHDQVEAMTLADRIAVLRDGAIEQIGSPRELYERPANLFVAEFIGSPKMNILSAIPPGLSESRSSAAFIGVRPEHIRLSDGGFGHCAGEVELSEYLGADTFAYVHCGDFGRITVRLPGDAAVAAGARVRLLFDKVHFFDESRKRISD